MIVIPMKIGISVFPSHNRGPDFRRDDGYGAVILFDLTPIPLIAVPFF
jgi:hypothetical protein